jgi:transposase
VQQRERPLISDAQLVELQQQADAHPQASLEQHIEAWATSHGVRVSRSTLCRALARADRPLKKTVNAQERDEGERTLFADQAATLAVKRLVVVDESGSKIGMSSAYARAPRGKRAVVQEPFNKGCNYTLLAALRQTGITAPFIVEGAADGAVFEVYVARVLAPTLQAGDLVIMDNVRFHKNKTVEALIHARGASILWLPAYSPDLSPIEHAFSKLKAWLRRAKALTEEALHQAIAQGLAIITEADALSWFIHCGYLNIA